MAKITYTDRFTQVPPTFKQKYRVAWLIKDDDSFHKKYFLESEYRNALALYLKLVADQAVGLEPYLMVALDGVAEIVGRSKPEWVPYFESSSSLANAM